MPDLGAIRYPGAEIPSSRRVGVEGTDPLLGADRPVFGGGVRHRKGRAVDIEA